MTAFDYTQLTMGEVSTIESLSGQTITSLDNEDAPKGLTLAALALIVKRRTGDPAFTWNQAQELTFAEIGDVLGTADDAEVETTDAAPFEVSEASTTSGKRAPKTNA